MHSHQIAWLLVGLSQCACWLHSSRTEIMGEPKIVIIGAGIAGLAAADHLINRHKFKNVTILEGSDRIGGRIYPVQIGPNAYMQIGAEWLHDRHNPLFEMAIKFGLIPDPCFPPDDFEAGKRLILEDGREMPARLKRDYHRSVLQKFTDVITSGSGEGYDVSSYGALMDDLFGRMIEKGKFEEKELRIMKAMQVSVKHRMEQLFSCSDWNRISLREYFESPEKATPHQKIALRTFDSSHCEDDPKGEISIHMNRIGYKAILDEMTTRVPPQKFVQFNSVVRKIRWNQSDDQALRVHLKLDDGQHVDADHVIITCSLGHLRANAKEMFEPELPEKKLRAIESIGFDTVDKLMLIFEERFWPEDTFVVQLLKDGGGGEGNSEKETPPCADDPRNMFETIFASKVHKNVMLVWIKDTDAGAFERTSDDVMANAAAQVLRQYFKDPHIPVPRIMRSSWKSNPLIMGSYSFNSIDQSKSARSDLGEPLTVRTEDKDVPLVLFAGEATHAPYPATTHGAFASGIREADRIAQFYHNR